MQTKGGEEDRIEGGDPTDNDDMDLDSEDIEDAPSMEEDSVNETSLARRDTKNDEWERHDEVVEDTSANLIFNILEGWRPLKITLSI